MEHLGIPSDIEYDIAMIVFCKYNDRIATMYDYEGEIYSRKEIRELEKEEDHLTNELRKAYIRGNYEDYVRKLL